MILVLPSSRAGEQQMMMLLRLWSDAKEFIQNGTCMHALQDFNAPCFFREYLLVVGKDINRYSTTSSKIRKQDSRRRNKINKLLLRDSIPARQQAPKRAKVYYASRLQCTTYYKYSMCSKQHKRTRNQQKEQRNNTYANNSWRQTIPFFWRSVSIVYESTWNFKYIYLYYR